MATIDAIGENKLRMARPVAEKIAGHADPKRHFPINIEKLFVILSAAHDVPKQKDDAK